MSKQNKKKMEGFKFRRGMAVEVNLDEENPNDDWFPAIFLQKVNFNSFLVEYYNSSNKDKSGPIEVAVDLFHIRPPPPNLEVEKFELLEKVDAFYDSAWRLGSITKIPSERRYTVFLRHGRHGKREKEFSHSELRPHMNFVDGNWVSNSKHKQKTASCEQLLGNANDDAASAKVATQLEYSRSAKDKIEEKTPCKNLRKNPMRQSTPPDNGPTLSDRSKKFRTKYSVQECHVKSMPDENQYQEAQAPIGTVTICSKHSLVCNKPSTENENHFKETGNEESAAENTVEGREIPSNSLVKRQLVVGAVEKNPEGYSAEDITELECKTKEIDSCVVLAAEMRDFPSDNSCQLSGQDILNAPYGQEQLGHCSNNDAVIQLECSTAAEGDIKEIIAVVAETSDSTSNDGQPLSLRFEGHSSVKSLKQCNDMSERQAMPFVKGSPVWRMVESLEVFRIMPQKPHFQPLFKCKELEREGFAIGQMVKFAEVVERTSKLRGYSPFDVFYSCLEALADLKMHGFDVEVVVCRINDLLLNKERLAQLQNQAKEVDIQIAELTHERSNLEEDIEAIDKKIRELEAKRALAMSMKERKDSEIFDLQTRASAISAHISKACHDFASLSGAP